MSMPTEFPDLFGETVTVGDFISIPISDMPYIAEVVGFTPKMVKVLFRTTPWQYQKTAPEIKLRELIPGRYIKLDPGKVIMLLLKNTN